MLRCSRKPMWDRLNLHPNLVRRGAYSYTSTGRISESQVFTHRPTWLRISWFTVNFTRGWSSSWLRATSILSRCFQSLNSTYLGWCWRGWIVRSMGATRQAPKRSMSVWWWRVMFRVRMNPRWSTGTAGAASWRQAIAEPLYSSF